jgi:hypothetical protein
MRNILLLIGVLVVIGIYPTCYYLSSETITITINKTERVNKGDDSKYLVFTDEETFENTDSYLSWKFDSSDVHGHLKEGQTYKVKVRGWRWKMFSSYRNIVELIE